MEKIRKSGRCKPDDNMRRISKIQGGFWVRFIRDNKILVGKTFNISKWGSTRRALDRAKIWRNMKEKELTKRRLLEFNWSANARFHIIGLSWTQRMDRGRFSDEIRTYCKKPKSGFNTHHVFSINKYGLEGAFNRAVEKLEQTKEMLPYPEKVKRKAFYLLKKEYKMLSIAHIK